MNLDSSIQALINYENSGSNRSRLKIENGQIQCYEMGIIEWSMGRLLKFFGFYENATLFKVLQFIHNNKEVLLSGNEGIIHYRSIFFRKCVHYKFKKDPIFQKMCGDIYVFFESSLYSHERKVSFSWRNVILGAYSSLESLGVVFDYSRDEEEMRETIATGRELGVKRISRNKPLGDSSEEENLKKLSYRRKVDPRGDGNCGISSECVLLAKGLEQGAVARGAVSSLSNKTRSLFESKLKRGNRYLFQRFLRGRRILEELMASPSEEELIRLIDDHEDHQALIYFVRMMSITAMLSRGNHLRDISALRRIECNGEKEIYHLMSSSYSQSLAQHGAWIDRAPIVVFFKELGVSIDVVVNDGEDIYREYIHQGSSRKIEGAALYRARGHFYVLYGD